MPATKKRNNRTPSSAPKSSSRAASWLVAVVLLVVVGAGVGLFLKSLQRETPGSSPASALAAGTKTAGSAVPAPSTNEVAQAVMVTVELDYGGKPPSIKEALAEVERRYEPEDGRGRTFAILDAYGETSPSGKLHMSMHVSMEKPGVGSLIFRRTGEVLWKSRIVPGKTPPVGEKSMTILMEDGTGRTVQLDGARGAARALDVPLRDSNMLVRDVWADGQVREFTFIYSVCGCPVKVKVQRTGETSQRTTELPVMFPDDPAALAVIQQLMGWPTGG
jgi:hypothetical protein